MGLDNGIILRTKKELAIPFFEKVVWDEPRAYDVCYWRKCHNIRSKILSVVSGSDEEYETTLDIEDLFAILKELLKFLNKKYCFENDETIWDYEDFASINRRNIKSLIKLILLYPLLDIERIYFYDSW